MIRYQYSGNGLSDSSLPLMTIHALFYNQAQFAKATLESMLAQSYGNTEVIVSDDYSPDGTGDVLLEVAKNYKGPHRVVVNINEKNLGIGDHFAHVLSLSHGEWQTSLGGDDIAEPDYLQTIYGYIKRYPNVVSIGSSAVKIDEEDNVIGEAYVVSEPKVYPRYESGPLTYSLNPGDDVAVVLVTGCVATFSKKLLEALPFPRGIMAEDAFLGFRASLLGDVLFIPEKCVRQRINGASIMRKGRLSKGRAERKKFRRRMSAMTFTTLDAVLTEVPLLRADVNSEALDTLLFEASESLLGSFYVPDPLGANYPKYREAVRMVLRRKSIFKVLGYARARGLFWPTLKLMVKGMFS